MAAMAMEDGLAETKGYAHTLSSARNLEKSNESYTMLKPLLQFLEMSGKKFSMNATDVGGYRCQLRHFIMDSSISSICLAEISPFTADAMDLGVIFLGLLILMAR
mmetsp:Transcript_8976/g.16447  ORF Transcript_8976/g.16447 Transcript_8976/m.16447 type:complete len:105 (-) Transcript_8976:379-693(-)|eukprot:CAMPEP_0201940508 /NCGR_PEP_ID=MMETSP0903-20130614/45377_1 /ASSEMBLY_ACC=CAM_ASM_000552 /TAXON_ID=420261 /ORGANISM="Thalassiosira antarctica, Strain CCMP982" /LENGTH=104 /DNA_ID=CAMNT_0048482335 /DNA_START=143 /DNA_END=457 /DNA_ORIENTATION=-